MTRPIATAALAAGFALANHAAFAHAVCGARIFPVTLTLDDPGVADEASLPTFTWQRSGVGDTAGPTNGYDFNFEYDKRITENLGIGINHRATVQQTHGDETRAGFTNLFVTAEYQTCVRPDHEFVFTVGLQQEFGGTGKVATGADQYGSTIPTLYFGKGLGDLPVDALRPFAITGELSYAIANRSLKATQVTDPDTGLMSLQYNNGNSNSWFGGVSVQYSIPYLQRQVKDYGLPPLIGRLTPLVEITWTSPASALSTQATTWTVAPGVLYSGDWFQLGIEADPGQQGGGDQCRRHCPVPCVLRRHLPQHAGQAGPRLVPLTRAR